MMSEEWQSIIVALTARDEQMELCLLKETEKVIDCDISRKTKDTGSEVDERIEV